MIWLDKGFRSGLHLGRASWQGPQKVRKKKVLALDNLAGQRTRKNRHYIGGRIGAQLLQVLHRQKELVVELPLCDLKKLADAV